MTDAITAPTPEHFELFFTLSKIDEQKRLVYGRATQEVPDYAKEVMDYQSSVPQFRQWSAAAKDRSSALGPDGLSLGNIRQMHQPIAAGKVTEINFDDLEKAIDIGTYCQDDDTWNKIRMGVLTGFSVGGEYGKRWPDPQNPRLMRYTAIPSEISYVDNPAVPTAKFTLIKSDNTTELHKVGDRLVDSLPVNPGGDAPADHANPADKGPTAQVEVVPTIVETKPVPVVGDKPEPSGLIEDENAVPIRAPKDAPAATELARFATAVETLAAMLKTAAEDRTAQETKLKQLGARVGIARKDGEPLTPPKDYPTEAGDYADPANWSWPVDKARYGAAKGRYNQGAGRDGYSTQEWATLGRRIVRLANRFDAGYEYDAKSKQINSKDEKKMNDVSLLKDMDAAGLLAQLKEGLKVVSEKIGSDPEALEALLVEAMRSAKPADTSNPSANPAGTSAGAISTVPSDKTAATPAVTVTPGSSSSTSSGSSGSSAEVGKMSKLEEQLSALTALVTKMAESQQATQMVKTADGQMIPINNLAGMVRPPQGAYPGMTPVIKAFIEGGPNALKKAAEAAGTKDAPDLVTATNELMQFVRDDMAESGMFTRIWGETNVSRLLNQSDGQN